MGGAEFDRLARRAVEAVERGVVALENLAKEDEITVEFGPPLCPSCGTFDPEVTTFDSQDTGKLSDFVIQAECRNCGSTIFGIVESYSMHQSRETAIQEIHERAERNAGS